MRRRRWRQSLAGRLFWPLAGVLVLALGAVAALQAMGATSLEAWLISLAPSLAALAWVLHQRLLPVLSLFRGLAGLVDSYRDGDFSTGVRWIGRDELGELVTAHLRLGEVLREQRLALTQRELLLDTMVQQTPVAMLLAVESGPVVYANLAARKLLNSGRRLEGFDLGALLNRSRPELAAAFERGADGVFSVGEGEDEEVFHLARKSFRLNGRPHLLLLIRRLTHELRRQEVQTWKKVIRVMSHEMNNALGPIASLSRSGRELLRRGEAGRLTTVLGTIEERARHLDQFLRGYAQFAKLPSPRRSRQRWGALLEPLAEQSGARVRIEDPEASVELDPAQISQALSNLVTNALDAGSPAADIEIRVAREGRSWVLEVADRGSGMTEEVMARALIPFYSTKRTGTGLGLALVREIAEAHGGQLALSHREGGGLRVVMRIPAAEG
ncbi:sensor histidine kinase [Pseudomarimonas salicorniae]|uniref:sensor histidine kinase n=1 Tax=Pseudomarimonas salicorniae TaxID=2933270 RepID=UPI003CCE3D0B